MSNALIQKDAATSTKTIPSAVYGQLELDGVEVKVMFPQSPKEHCAFAIYVHAVGQKPVGYLLPMDYEPVFGVDVSDANNLENAVDAILESLNKSHPVAYPGLTEFNLNEGDPNEFN